MELIDIENNDNSQSQERLETLSDPGPVVNAVSTPAHTLVRAKSVTDDHQNYSRSDPIKASTVDSKTGHVNDASKEFETLAMPPPATNRIISNPNEVLSTASTKIAAVNGLQTAALIHAVNNVNDDAALYENMERQALLEIQARKDREEEVLYEEMERQALLEIKTRKDQEEAALYDEMERQALLEIQARKENATTTSDLDPPVSSCASPSIAYLRLMALEIVEDFDRRIKRIRCFQLADNPIQTTGDKSGMRTDLQAVLTVELTGKWFETAIIGGDVFNIVDLNGHAVTSSNVAVPTGSSMLLSGPVRARVTDTLGLVIIHPDLMVAPTKIAEANDCQRRAVLQEKMKIGGSSYAAAMGNLKHQFVEELLSACFNKIQTSFAVPGSGPLLKDSEIDDIISRSIKSHLSALHVHVVSHENCATVHKEKVTAGQLEEMVQRELRQLTVPTILWARKVSETMEIPGLLGIQGLESVEERLMCPALGLQGQVDAIAIATIDSKATNPFLQPFESLRDAKTVVVPLELKTGKESSFTANKYRAQVILYIIMLIARELNSADTLSGNRTLPLHGLLLYVPLEGKSIMGKVITPMWEEVLALIMTRNSLASHLKRAEATSALLLPPLLKRRDECESCYQAAECMLLHSAESSVASSSSSLRDSAVTATLSATPELYFFSMRQIPPSQVAYFTHWLKLVDLESLASTGWHQRIKSANGSVQRRHEVGQLCRTLKVASQDSQHIYELTFRRDASVTGACILRESDRVIVHFMYRKQVATTQCTDIEDFASTSGNRPYTLREESDSTGASVSSGVVLFVLNAEIVVRVTGVLPSLLISMNGEQSTEISSHGSKELVGLWFGRISKDDGINVALSTMRSSLAQLFVDAHSPPAIKEARRSFHAAKVGKDAGISSQNIDSRSERSDRMTGSFNALAPNSRQRLRSLIIDLAAPHFQPLSAVAEGAGMFCPKNVQLTQFMHAIKLLNAYEAAAKSDPSLSNYSGPVKRNPINGNLRVPLTANTFLTVYAGCNPTHMYREFCRLNPMQKAVFRKVFVTDDYALLLGLPGTGKTTTISLIVRALIARHERVLITSYTHSAVDNLLAKLVASGVRPSTALRVGTSSSVDDSLHNYMMQTDNCSLPALSTRLIGVRVVCATVLAAARDAIVRSMSFDWCILDEAGQVSQPAAIGAVMRASKFLLIGDDYQLPPMIVSAEARQLGMDESLLRRLAEAHPSSVMCLFVQHRMNGDIMSVCNTLIYEGRLQCSSDDVKNARLSLPHFDQLRARIPLWLSRVMHPEESVLMLNTDYYAPLPLSNTLIPISEEGEPGKTLTNVAEARLVRFIVEGLRDCGLNVSGGLGVICPYRDQVALLKQELKNSVSVISGLARSEPHQYSDMLIASFGQFNGSQNSSAVLADDASRSVHASTVDQFQGKDCDVVIFSTVRQGRPGLDVGANAGDLLRDWRRINVAVTRAKVKLLIIGSKSVMQSVPVLSRFVDLCSDNKWVLDVPVDILTSPGDGLL